MVNTLTRYSTISGGSIFVLENIFSIKLMEHVLDAVLKMPLVKSTPESGGFDTISFDMGICISHISFNKIYELMYKRLERYLKKEFSLDTTFDRGKIGNPSIKIQNIGQHHVIHSDYEYSNSDMNVASKILVENSISSVICLNSNYAGGELIFPDDGISIDLKAGSACVFTSAGNRHGVTEVTGGVRYSLLNFGEVIYNEL